MIKRFKTDEKALIKAKEQIYKKQVKEIEKIYEGLADAIESDIKVKGEDYSDKDLRAILR